MADFMSKFHAGATRTTMAGNEVVNQDMLGDGASTTGIGSWFTERSFIRTYTLYNGADLTAALPADVVVDIEGAFELDADNADGTVPVVIATLTTAAPTTHIEALYPYTRANVKALPSGTVKVGAYGVGV